MLPASCGRGETTNTAVFKTAISRQGLVVSSPTVRTQDSTSIFKNSIDKQRALAVFCIHDEPNTNRNHDDLRSVQDRLPALWKASQWPSPLPLPRLQDDLHGGAQESSGNHVHQPRQGRPCPSAFA